MRDPLEIHTLDLIAKAALSQEFVQSVALRSPASAVIRQAFSKYKFSLLVPVV